MDIDKNVPVRMGERDGCDIYVVAVEEIAEALEKHYSETATIVKCPFFNKPCLKEGCSAFELRDINLWSSRDLYDYRAFEQEKVFFENGDLECVKAIGIPFCRILDKELPMKIEN